MSDRAMPELLVTLAHELRRRVASLVPQLSQPQLDALVTDLISGGHRAWGNEFPVAAEVPPADLPNADPVYSVLYDAWYSTLAQHVDLPTEWSRVAACQLLDVARKLLGGMYVPKGRPQRALRDRRMWDAFNGNYRAVAVDNGLTDRRTRQIIDGMRRADIQDRQGQLFSDQ